MIMIMIIGGVVVIVVVNDDDDALNLFWTLILSAIFVDIQAKFILVQGHIYGALMEEIYQ